MVAAVAAACGSQPDAGSSSPGAEAALPDTASPLDALPEGVRGMLDQPFTGDFDAMVKRRFIRVGVTFNRTHYFIDRGQERGLTYEALKSFENDLNADLKTGNLKVHVVLVPMSRNQLHPALAERHGGHGRGDGDGEAGAGTARRVLGTDPHRREPGGRHRARARRRSPRSTILPARRCSSARRAPTTRPSPA